MPGVRCPERSTGSNPDQIPVHFNLNRELKATFRVCERNKLLSLDSADQNAVIERLER